MTKRAGFPPDRDLPGPRMEAIKEVLMNEIDRTHRRQKSRARLIAVAAAGMLLLTAVGAGAYMATQPDEMFTSLGCYEDADLASNVAVVNTAPDRQPTEVCAELWRTGEVGQEDNGPAPDLTACVLPSGEALGVFPGKQGTCAALGLTALDDVDVDPDAPSVAQLRGALVQHISHDCLGQEQAVAVVREQFHTNGFDDWTVQVETDIDDDECASFGIHPATRTVELGPIPAR